MCSNAYIHSGQKEVECLRAYDHWNLKSLIAGEGDRPTHFLLELEGSKSPMKFEWTNNLAYMESYMAHNE